MTEVSHPAVGVVCPTYRRPQLLARLVAALEAQTYPLDRVEVRIIDDSSRDGTEEVLARLARETSLRLVPMATSSNAGPAAARNLGWRASTAPVVAFTDDDCVPGPRWLEAGVAALGHSSAIGVVQGRVTRPPDVPLGPWSLFREVDGPTPYFEGCNVFYGRDALDQVGGFDEGFSLPYGEDTDLAWRVLDGGWERAFADDAVVCHDIEERGFRYRLRFGYVERHLIGIGARHPGFAAAAYWRPWAWEPETVAMAAALVGLAGMPRARASALLALPWLRLRWPRGEDRRHLLLGPQRALLDTVRLAGHLAGSLRYRTFVL